MAPAAFLVAPTPVHASDPMTCVGPLNAPGHEGLDALSQGDYGCHETDAIRIDDRSSD